MCNRNQEYQSYQTSQNCIWIDEAWLAAEDIYQSILDHPFIKELSAGTLPREKYIHYLSQDSLYLREYFRVLAHIASRLEDSSHAESFLRFALDGILVERSMHSLFLDHEGGSERVSEKSPACELYTSFLKSHALEPVETEAAAVLPCFVVYLKVGLHILATAKNLDGNPYREWILTYADEAFRKSTERAVEICNELAQNASPTLRRRMSGAFREATRLEWLFWDSAWRLEKSFGV